MKEQLITFKTAKLAKEKGFEVATIHSYELSEVLCYKEKAHNWNGRKKLLGVDKYFNAPTQSLLQKWLREKHRIVVLIAYPHTDDNKVGGINSVTFDVQIYKLHGGDAWKKHILKGITDDYEYTLEKGLQEALKLVKS